MPIIETEEQIDTELFELAGTGANAVKLHCNRTGYYIIQNLSDKIITFAYNNPQFKTSDYKPEIFPRSAFRFPKLEKGTELYLEGDSGAEVLWWWARNKFPDTFLMGSGFDAISSVYDYTWDGSAVTDDDEIDFLTLYGRYATKFEVLDAQSTDFEVRMKFANDSTYGDWISVTGSAGESFKFPEDGDKVLIEKIEVQAVGGSGTIYPKAVIY